MVAPSTHSVNGTYVMPLIRAARAISRRWFRPLLFLEGGGDLLNQHTSFQGRSNRSDQDDPFQDSLVEACGADSAERTLSAHPTASRNSAYYVRHCPCRKATVSTCWGGAPEEKTIASAKAPLGVIPLGGFGSRAPVGQIDSDRTFTLQAISYIPQQNYAAAEIEHPEKVLSVSFVTDYKPTKVLQPGKQSLDLPTSAIPSQAS
jgi:hypothetical protein